MNDKPNPDLTLSDDERRRYQRHLILPDIGEKGQMELKSSGVLIVGAGGLGSPAALYLAAAGVGRIGIIDHDIVELSNLQRQIAHSDSDVGLPKADSAGRRVKAVNPNVNVEIHRTRLGPENADVLFSQYDIVVDCTDNYTAHYLVNDTAVRAGIPFIHGSISQFEGYVSVFDTDRGPCYRCLYPEAPPQALAPGCGETGVVGAVPGIIGSLQAMETIKIITGIGELLIGRLLIYNALKSDFHEIRFARNPSCAVCSSEHEAGSAASGREMTDAVAPALEQPDTDRITPEELKQKLDDGDVLFLLDVREPFEYQIANMGGVLIPLAELGSRIDELDRSKDIVVYCHRGIRSAHAVRLLRRAGFQNVKNLVGGISAWSEKIDPSIPVY